jgi:hypothetical protein
MSDAPHAPKLDYRCEDYYCCDNGAPIVTCRSCGRLWPCLAWQETHTEAQLKAQRRWVARKHFPNNERMVEYLLRNPQSYWADLPQTAP